QLHMLAQSVTHVFHLAAIYDLAVPEDIARMVNVEGTKQVNEWVSFLPHLQRYVYFSTAYVSGTRQGVIFEHELDKGQSFKNHYEKDEISCRSSCTRSSAQRANDDYSPWYCGWSFKNRRNDEI
ncbi:SDR family oxidoreductase, partial [Anoxybacillus sp. KU2-6(11)]|uniref:SDR family oxidoreductase n=1 Tax=Anoxybacillus sp. KU2-6(11) TaxID=1535751 RepID=UPI001E2D505F